MTDEAPIAWRCSWVLPAQRGAFYHIRPEPFTKDFCSQQEADALKAQIHNTHPEATVCVTPVYVSRAKRNNGYKRKQTSAITDWPLQARITEGKL